MWPNRARDKRGTYTLGLCAAAAMLAGCVLRPGAMPQNSAIAPAAAVPHRATAPYYRDLFNFADGGRSHGALPLAGLVDVNGTLYGTTAEGGLKCKHGAGQPTCGTVYRISTAGAEKNLYSFSGGSDGSFPEGSFVDVKGTLYGTTNFGGSCDQGTVYRISTTGAETVLHSFCGSPDGDNPQAGLIDVNGTLYGTTFDRGDGCFPFGCGIVYRISTTGVEKVLHHFKGGADGQNPEAGLIYVNGSLYGTTYFGGPTRNGIVFSISTAGDEIVLHSFARGSDGANPQSGLIDVKGTLYGTTVDGGPSNDGTVYSITTAGVEKVLHSFSGTDGANPQTGLIDVKGTLYGTTVAGGSSGKGTVFSVSTTGTETVLHSFARRLDPQAALIYVNGTLYGTTAHGGGGPDHGSGTVFALTP